MARCTLSIGPTGRRVVNDRTTLVQAGEAVGADQAGRRPDRRWRGVGRGAAGAVAVYARVSSADQRADLDRHVARVTSWATGEGLTAGRVAAEVGSALNGRPGEFFSLLRDHSVSTIIVEHRDRFAVFGAEYVEAALAAFGRRLLLEAVAGTAR